MTGPNRKRYLWEVVVVDRDCELGKEGERAVVVGLSERHMTLLFADRASVDREVNTGADYLYLRTTISARK